MKNLIENSEFTEEVPVPEDGVDRRTAGSLHAAFQALANRTRKLLDMVTTQTAGHIFIQDGEIEGAFGEGFSATIHDDGYLIIEWDTPATGPYTLVVSTAGWSHPGRLVAAKVTSAQYPLAVIEVYADGFAGLEQLDLKHDSGGGRISFIRIDL